jgi:glucose-6-phosphate isomerase
MQLSDEAIEYHFQNSLCTLGDEWHPLAELQATHFLTKSRLSAIYPTLTAIRGQIAAEREKVPGPNEPPLQPGFIEYPQKLLEGYRKQGNGSEMGRVLSISQRLREETDRVVVIGVGGSYMGARALFEALLPTYHNELPPQARTLRPRIYFEGNSFDNDSLQDLLDLLESTCVDPELRDERWGAIVISKGGETLETAVAYRRFREEASRFYGSQSPRRRQLIVPVTGNKGKFRDLLINEGYVDEDILPIPDNVGGRFSVFTAVGLLPAATMGLDIRALLLGAAAMTRRFFDEPVERNPVLQFAAVNHLMAEELHKPVRVLSVWSKRLESLGFWYDQLLSESLGKQGRGATPVTAVQTRDLHSRGQQHQDGVRDKLVNNVIVKNWRTPGIPIGMADRNEDNLNRFSRKTYPHLMAAAVQGTNEAYLEVARPTSDIVLPSLSEHTLGQLMQMLMLATIVEGRLMGVNPYGQPGVQAYKRKMIEILERESK